MGLVPEIPEGVDWWDPMADNAVRPEIDAVLVNGIRVARGSQVRLRPRRNADAQDIFVAGKTARVTSVHEDVEGNKHVGVVVDDDPAADLHDWYGRYLYFSPDEIEPLETSEPVTIKKGIRHGSLRLDLRRHHRVGRRGRPWCWEWSSLPDARRYLKLRRM